MKVLTVYQPWASLILVGAKPYEFRGWRVPAAVVNQRIGLHASKRLMLRDEIEQLLRVLNSKKAWATCLKPEIAVPLLERALVEPEILPRSAILCTARVGESRNGFDIAREFGGPVNDSDRGQHANYGWPLSNIWPLNPPIEARGMQGLWNHGGLQ